MRMFVCLMGLFIGGCSADQCVKDCVDRWCDQNDPTEACYDAADRATCSNFSGCSHCDCD